MSGRQEDGREYRAEDDNLAMVPYVGEATPAPSVPFLTVADSTLTLINSPRRHEPRAAGFILGTQELPSTYSFDSPPETRFWLEYSAPARSRLTTAATSSNLTTAYQLLASVEAGASPYQGMDTSALDFGRSFIPETTGFYYVAPSEPLLGPAFAHLYSQAAAPTDLAQAQAASLAMYPALTDPYNPSAKNAKKLKNAGVEDKDIPEYFKCALTCEVMDEPVKLPSGTMVEKGAILKHIRENRRLNPALGTFESFDPYTREPLNESDISVDTAMKEQIEKFVAKKVAESEAELSA